MTGLDSLTQIVENLAVVIARQQAPNGAGEITAWGTSQVILIAVLAAMMYLNIRSQNLLFKAVAPIQEVVANQKIQDSKINDLTTSFKDHKTEDKEFHSKITEKAADIERELVTIKNQK